MRINRKQTEAAQRYAERRQRENDAPRLRQVAPDLVALSLEVEERAPSGGSLSKHVRRIVVENAPALFIIPCSEARCLDGGHDVTYSILAALRDKQATFDGSDECRGSLGTGHCSRTLHFHGVAKYQS